MKGQPRWCRCGHAKAYHRGVDRDGRCKGAYGRCRCRAFYQVAVGAKHEYDAWRCAQIAKAGT